MKKNRLIQLLSMLALSFPPTLFAGGMAAEWSSKLLDGATGEVTMAGDALQINKTNAIGMVQVQFAIPHKIKKGEKYWVSCEYRTENAQHNSLLLLRPVAAPQDPVTFNVIGGDHWVWANNSSVRNTPAGVWDDHYTTFAGSADSDRIYVNALIWGNPFSLQLRNVRVFDYPEPTIVQPPLEEYRNRVSREALLEHLAKRPESVAKLSSVNGRKIITVNDQIDGVAVYKGLGGHGPNRGLDIAHFGDLGINTVIRNLPTGKNHPGDRDGFWLGEGEYDFAKVDAMIYDTLEKNPDANIIVDFWLKPYQFWYKNHPTSELAVNSSGERAYGPGLYGTFTSDYSIVENPGSGKHWIPSWSSNEYLDSLRHLVKSTMEHIKKQPYGKAVVGAIFTGGDDGQFGFAFYDHSEAAKRNFHEFLERKYRTIESVNRAWGSTYANFSEIPIPDRRVTDWSVMHMQPGRTTDYHQAQFESTYRFRDELAGVVKSTIGKPSVVISYGHPSGDYFSDLQNIDGFCFQPGYPQRKVGVATTNFPRTLHHRDDKLFMTEFDSRGLPDPNPRYFYYDGVGGHANLSEWKNAHRKLIGQSIAKGYSHWYYDMHQYFNAPAYRAEIAEIEAILKKLYERPKTSFQPDVCVVMSSREMEFNTNWYLMTEHINYNPQYQEFELSGVPMDKLYISELCALAEKGKLPDYKVLIFFQNAYFTQKERDFIENKLKKDGRTIVWIYDPGFLSDSGADPKEFSNLIGFNVAYRKNPEKLTPLYIANAPYMKGVPEFFSGSGWLSTIMPQLPGWESFRITDPEATPLARFREDGSVAAAVRKFPEWTSIYLASPQSLHGKLLQNIVKESGGFTSGDYGQQLDMDADFVSIHGIVRNPAYTFRFPKGKQTLRDAATGAVLAKEADSYTFEVEPWQTYWFFLE